MTCSHCTAAVSGELRLVPGVDSVDVDLDARLVTVRGRDLDEQALRTAVDEAGYEATTRVGLT
jgi:copper chaperone CopZ